MATEPNTYADGSFLTGSYDVTINGYSYTLDQLGHDLPISQADAMNADGTPKGGAFVKGKQKLSVKINAISGTPAPAQLIPFALAIHGYASKNWLVTGLKISSANTGASIRTYDAEICQHINAIS